MRTLVRAVRRRWRVRAWLRGGLLALTLAGGTVALLLLLDMVPGLGLPWRATLRWSPLLLTLVPLALAVLSARSVRGDRSVALLLEELDTSLEHLVTTALESDLTTPAGAAFRRRAEVRAARIPVGTLIPLQAGGRGVSAALALAAVGTLLAVSPGGVAGAWGRWFDGAAADRTATELPRGRAEGESDRLLSPPAFSSLRATLVPPSYTGLPAGDLDPQGVLPVLPGTRMTLRVGTTGGTLEAQRIGVGALPLDQDDGGAVARWTVSAADRGVDLALRGATDGEAIVDRRVVALSILEDRPPQVTLELPAVDLVVASASGRVPLQARVVDDFGTRDWSLHWVRSSGSGESFSFEEGTWTWDAVERHGDTLVGRGSIDLSTLGLAPGDVLHLRAQARDGNDVTGPGLGVSATRLIRVASVDDLDEVSTLIGFPIEREREPLLSQRMIILLTEELLADADSLSEQRFAERSAAIADEQDRLRARVEEVMFVREAADAEPGEEGSGQADPTNVLDPPDPMAPPPVLEAPGHDHDGSAIAEVNEDLIAAFNAMWDASRLLRQTEPSPSLVPQHVALDHLQALRDADRVYARGAVSRPPLDLAAARGTGEVDEARPAYRNTGPPSPDGQHWRGEIETLASDLALAPPSLALRLRTLAAALLGARDGSVEAASRIAGAADRVDAADYVAARALLAEAARALTPVQQAGRESPADVPANLSGAAYLERLAVLENEPADPARRGRSASATPFVFATARYGSGDWDSAPLVPSNLVHSLAQYTALPVEEEGRLVDLSSPELLRFPFVFLTGHLPLRLDDAESANLKRYVERGGFLFIDDHNHDIDGAFHRSVLSELARIFGGDALQPLPKEHDLYRAFFVFEDGPPITGHELSGWGDGLIHRELFAVQSQGRIGVLYSNKDYSSEWNYHAENKRFLALDNTRFGVNLILYALTR